MSQSGTRAILRFDVLVVGGGVRGVSGRPSAKLS